ncbi:MAG: protein ImuB [Yoonia sp.]|jgi:protein ImuB
MTTKDKLPVLARHTPPKDTPKPIAPDQLEQAVAALRDALEAEVRSPAPKPPVPPPVSKKVGRVGAAAGAVTLPTQTKTSTRRIIAIHLPDFAMERWERWATAHSMRPPEDLPVVLALDGAHGPTVYAANRAARSEGITQSTRIVDARALCPTLRVEFADIGGDQAALGKLMLWARRWCPWTAIDGPAGLVLDTTGSDHLWGGEAVMLRDIEERLARLGLSANLSCAPTHGTAWALSRLGGVREICTTAQLDMRLSPMPVRALRIDGGTVQLLQRLGLKTVGDLMAVPRISLARRFSKAALAQNPLLRLDQMTGQLAEPISAAADPPRFTVQANLAEPVQDPTPHLPGLCSALCVNLEAAGVGARRITVTVYRTDGEVRHITVKTAVASRDANHIRRLFDNKLDRIDPGFGFDLITLSAHGVEPVRTGQIHLDGTQPDNAALAQLIDRLSARLGAKLISQPVPAPSHLPERAEVWNAALAAPTVQRQQPPTRRPLKIFDHPEEIKVLYAVPEGPPAQFVWRKVTHRVVRYAGPERIAPEWWKDMPGTRLRDYYDIEDQKAHRLWLYREGVWGDMRGNDPRWFVHGVFA